MKRTGVTPYVGVWIETDSLTYVHARKLVTPYVGVWIETRWRHRQPRNRKCHSLCGSVD